MFFDVGGSMDMQIEGYSRGATIQTSTLLLFSQLPSKVWEDNCAP